MKSSAVSRFDTSRLRIWFWTSEMCVSILSIDFAISFKGVSSSNASIQIRRTKHDEILSLFRREDLPEFSSRLSDDSSDGDLMNSYRHWKKRIYIVDKRLSAHLQNNLFIQCQDEIYKINAENQIDLRSRWRVNVRQFGDARCTAIASRLGWTIIVCWIRCLSEKDIVIIFVLMFHWMTIIGQMSSAKRRPRRETINKAWRSTYALAVESVMLDFRVFIRRNSSRRTCSFCSQVNSATSTSTLTLVLKKASDDRSENMERISSPFVIVIEIAEHTLGGDILKGLIECSHSSMIVLSMLMGNHSILIGVQALLSIL